MMLERKISCLVVDDEPMALKLIESYVLKVPYLELKATCSNAFEAMEVLAKESIDLLFLDIQMPELSGLELSKTLPKTTRVVFTTAFDQYALDGYKVEALDYLLKPFDMNEFLLAATKAKEWFSLAWGTKTEPKEEASGYIFVNSEYKQLKINLDHIAYVERNQVIIHQQRINIADQYKAAFTDFMAHNSMK